MLRLGPAQNRSSCGDTTEGSHRKLDNCVEMLSGDFTKTNTKRGCQERHHRDRVANQAHSPVMACAWTALHEA